MVSPHYRFRGGGWCPQRLWACLRTCSEQAANTGGAPGAWVLVHPVAFPRHSPSFGRRWAERRRLCWCRRRTLAAFQRLTNRWFRRQLLQLIPYMAHSNTELALISTKTTKNKLQDVWWDRNTTFLKLNATKYFKRQKSKDKWQSGKNTKFITEGKVRVLLFGSLKE